MIDNYVKFYHLTSDDYMFANYVGDSDLSKYGLFNNIRNNYYFRSVGHVMQKYFNLKLKGISDCRKFIAMTLGHQRPALYSQYLMNTPNVIIKHYTQTAQESNKITTACSIHRFLGLNPKYQEPILMA